MNPFDLDGPRFLVFYLCFAAALVLALHLARRARESAAPLPGNLKDPYLLAYLGGGRKEVVRVSTLALIDRGLLEMTGKLVRSRAGPSSRQTRVEQAVLRHFANPSELESVFTAPEPNELARVQYAERLRRDRLLPDQETLRSRYLWMALTILAMIALTALRTRLALERGHPNLVFLYIMTFLAVVAVVNVGNPFRTSLGDTYLRRMRDLFSHLPGRVASIKPGGASAELLWLAALFGVGAVPATAFPFISEFRLKKEVSSGSGCGSSCSSGCGGGGGGCGGCGS
jgi:uncharacterized protein (TIGR04222 family)